MHHILGYDYNRWAILKTTLKTLSIYKIWQVNPRTWHHLGRAKITNQTGGKTNKKTTECDVKETHTCTRYLQYFTPKIKHKRITHGFAVFLIIHFPTHECTFLPNLDLVSTHLINMID